VVAHDLEAAINIDDEPVEPERINDDHPAQPRCAQHAFNAEVVGSGLVGRMPCYFRE